MTKNPPLEGFLLARATCRHARSHSTLWHVCRYPHPWLPAFPSPLQAARSGRCSQQTSPPAIGSQRNQGHRAVQSAHPPCHQVAMYLPSAAHISTSSSRQHAVKRVEQDRFNGCTTVINRRISANLRACCRQKMASRQGKIPGARQEMLGVGKMGLTAVQTMPDSPHRQQNCLLLPTKF